MDTGQLKPHKKKDLIVFYSSFMVQFFNWMLESKSANLMLTINYLNLFGVILIDEFWREFSVIFKDINN